LESSSSDLPEEIRLSLSDSPELKISDIKSKSSTNAGNRKSKPSSSSSRIIKKSHSIYTEASDDYATSSKFGHLSALSKLTEENDSHGSIKSPIRLQVLNTPPTPKEVEIRKISTRNVATSPIQILIDSFINEQVEAKLSKIQEESKKKAEEKTQASGIIKRRFSISTNKVGRENPVKRTSQSMIVRRPKVKNIKLLKNKTISENSKKTEKTKLIKNKSIAENSIKTDKDKNQKKFQSLVAQLTPVRTNLLGRPSVFPLPSTPYTGSPGLTNRTYLQSNVYSGKLKSQKMSVAQAIVSPKIDRLKNDSNYRTWRIEEKSNIDRRASLSGFDNLRTFARNATTPMALTPCVPFN